jgi:hypothetical protein
LVTLTSRIPILKQNQQVICLLSNLYEVLRRKTYYQYTVKNFENSISLFLHEIIEDLREKSAYHQQLKAVWEKLQLDKSTQVKKLKTIA